MVVIEVFGCFWWEEFEDFIWEIVLIFFVLEKEILVKGGLGKGIDLGILGDNVKVVLEIEVFWGDKVIDEVIG